MANATVFPEPVWDEPMQSRPVFLKKNPKKGGGNFCQLLLIPEGQIT
jgi:hypothetical protein